MGDEALVERTDEPVTVPSMAADLRDLGVGAGDVLLVHSSLSALGWVCGGAQAVVAALQDVLTDAGTLVMPTHTPQLSDPARWRNPPVPDSWVGPVRETMPPYRPAVTPTWQMGAIAESFRTYPGVLRSDHPLFSFAAWGRDAETVVSDHALDDGLGEDSPLARVYDLDGDVLLLGVGYGSNTSFHLAEYRADLDADRTTNTAPVVRDGERVRVEFAGLDTSADDFADLGADFEGWADVEDWSGPEDRTTVATVGEAEATLASQPAMVDFAVDWLGANR